MHTTNDKPIIRFYTDGSCRTNPGPGGYGVLMLIDGWEVTKEYSEHCDSTTNNREELKAIIKALEAATSLLEEMPNTFDKIYIYSDSAYCVNMCNDWIWTWARNDWKNSKKKVVENVDLVHTLYKYLNKDFFNCQVEIRKVKGHVGIWENEYVDALATGDEKKKKLLLSQQP